MQNQFITIVLCHNYFPDLTFFLLMKEQSEHSKRQEPKYGKSFRVFITCETLEKCFSHVFVTICMLNFQHSSFLWVVNKVSEKLWIYTWKESSWKVLFSNRCKMLLCLQRFLYFSTSGKLWPLSRQDNYLILTAMFIKSTLCKYYNIRV